VTRYVNEPETTLKQSQNILELFQCFVSHVRAPETKHCFGFVLHCSVSVVRAALAAAELLAIIPTFSMCHINIGVELCGMSWILSMCVYYFVNTGVIAQLLYCCMTVFPANVFPLFCRR